MEIESFLLQIESETNNANKIKHMILEQMLKDWLYRMFLRWTICSSSLQDLFLN